MIGSTQSENVCAANNGAYAFGLSPAHSFFFSNYSSQICMPHHPPAGTDAFAHTEQRIDAAHPEFAVSERRLWCAVIEQAFMDAGFIEPAKGIERQRFSPFSHEYKDAVRWLLNDHGEFVRVCMMAGVSPALIRQAAREFV